MYRQQAHVEELLRSQHDKLVAELRLRERNIVFPDTVRNQGIFYRNLAGEGIHAYTSHRMFAAFWGLFLLAQCVVIPLILGLELLAVLGSLLASLLLIAVGLKVTVNAVIREQRPKLALSKTYPHVKI
jgi:hypothetical protein